MDAGQAGARCPSTSVLARWAFPESGNGSSERHSELSRPQSTLKLTPSFWMFSAALAASDGRHPKREGDFEGGGKMARALWVA